MDSKLVGKYQMECAHFCSLIRILTPIMVDIGAKEIVQDEMELGFKFAIKEGIKHCQVKVRHNTSHTFRLQVENFVTSKPSVYDRIEEGDLKEILMYLFMGKNLNNTRFKKWRGESKIR